MFGPIAVIRYLAERLDWEWGETGISSDAMLREALGGAPLRDWEYPHDSADLARCRMTYENAPRKLRRRMQARMQEFETHVASRAMREERPATAVS